MQGFSNICEEKIIYIVPVFRFDSTKIVGYALSVREKPLIDSDVVAHFPRDATGKEIKNVATELGHTNVKWSEKIIEV